jgi:hypothetical protein
MQKGYHVSNKQEDNKREMKMSQGARREDQRWIKDRARRSNKKKGSFGWSICQLANAGN